MSKSNIRLSNIQKALYHYLYNGLEGITVENRISLDTQKPYVAMADLGLRTDDARMLDGQEVIQELVIYSNFNGKDEVINIVDAIRDLVVEREVEIENVDTLGLRVDDISISQMDKAIYEGQLFLKFTIFEDY